MLWWAPAVCLRVATQAGSLVGGAVAEAPPVWLGVIAEASFGAYGISD